MKKIIVIAALACSLTALLAVSLQAEFHPMEPQPKAVSTPHGKAPSDAVVLFDGSSLSAWSDVTGNPTKWKLEDGVMIVNDGNIRSKQEFSDVQLHLEFATPNPAQGEGQGRGNSGVYFSGLYEVQILDSYKSDTYINGMVGAIYNNFSPLVNACRPPGEWQEYDIIFRSPRFDREGRITQKACLTVILNGVLLQDHVYVTMTPGGLGEIDKPSGPIFMQDHGNPVKYRNIWVREL